MRLCITILLQVAIYRRLLIGRNGHLDQSEAYDISQLVREYGTCISIQQNLASSSTGKCPSKLALSRLEWDRGPQRSTAMPTLVDISGK